MVRLYSTGAFTVTEVGELFNVSRSTVYRAARRADGPAADDDSTPAGVAYENKHGTGRCWAYWLPDGEPGQHHPTSDDGSPILLSDEDLRRVADRLRIHVW